MAKSVFVADLKPGFSVDEVFVAVDKQVLVKKDGAGYLTASLCDSSGRVKAVAWDNLEAIKPAFESGDYVWVKGRVSEYRGELQVVLSEAARLDPEGVDPADFLPATRRDTGQMLSQLKELADTITDQDVKVLCGNLLADEVMAPALCRAPAAKMMHHAWVGGLLEHTLSVTAMASKVSAHYTGLDRDILMAGAIFHDLGKIEEFSLKGAIDYSDVGKLISHVVLGVGVLDRFIARIEGFPAEKAMLLRHMVVSHHGQREFGSPEPPKTLEAVVLNLIDDLDAKVVGIRSFMDSDTGDSAWSAHHKLLGRSFYKGAAR